MSLKLAFCIPLLLITVANLSGQENSFDESPKLFLDCQRGCDHRFIRDQLPFLDFMRDRQSANIFIQLTELRTGTGGTEYTMRIVGQKVFEGITDTLSFFTDPDATDNIERNQVVLILKKAVLPYLLKTPIADKIEYKITGLKTNELQTNGDTDPWNYWVFRFRGNSFFSGQESFKEFNLFSSFSASRTTPQSKFSISGYHEYNRSKFKLSDEEDFISTTIAAGGNLRYVKSMTDHWSVGFRSRVSESSYSNIDFSANLKPAIEYSYFPYEQATQKQFTFTYSIGPVYNNYMDTTILNQVSELIVQQSLDIGMTQIKDWGSISIDFSIRNYLINSSYTRVTINPRIEWNVYKGLNINLFSRISYVGDLINISKLELGDEEILLRTSQLDTNFEYWGSFGVSYRFGSSVNNVVNTRFDNFDG